MHTDIPDRSVILLPVGGKPRIVAAERSIFDQACRFCGDTVQQIPCSSWKSDRFRAMVAAAPTVGSSSNVNLLASKVVGTTMHGDCVLARRPAKDDEMYGKPHRSDRFMQAFDPETASEALSALGE